MGSVPRQQGQSCGPGCASKDMGGTVGRGFLCAAAPRGGCAWAPGPPPRGFFPRKGWSGHGQSLCTQCYWFGLGAALAQGYSTWGGNWVVLGHVPEAGQGLWGCASPVLVGHTCTGRARAQGRGGKGCQQDDTEGTRHLPATHTPGAAPVSGVLGCPVLATHTWLT